MKTLVILFALVVCAVAATVTRDTDDDEKRNGHFSYENMVISIKQYESKSLVLHFAAPCCKEETKEYFSNISEYILDLCVLK